MMAGRPQTSVELTVWAMVVYGLTLILTTSSLFAGARRHLLRIHPMLGALARCPMCLGFWVGAAGALMPSLRVVDTGFLPCDLILSGAASSGWCWMVHVVMTRMGQNDL